MGTKLHSVHRSKVTFEVDQYDQTRRSGRSVRHYGALPRPVAGRGQTAITTG